MRTNVTSAVRKCKIQKDIYVKNENKKSAVIYSAPQELLNLWEASSPRLWVSSGTSSVRHANSDVNRRKPLRRGLHRLPGSTNTL